MFILAVHPVTRNRNRGTLLTVACETFPWRLMPSAWELRITRLDTWISEDPGRTELRNLRTPGKLGWHGYAWLRFLDDWWPFSIFLIVMLLTSPKKNPAWQWFFFGDLGVKKSTLELRLGTRGRSRFQVAIKTGMSETGWSWSIKNGVSQQFTG